MAKSHTTTETRSSAGCTVCDATAVGTDQLWGQLWDSLLVCWSASLLVCWSIFSHVAWNTSQWVSRLYIRTLDTGNHVANNHERAIPICLFSYFLQFLRTDALCILPVLGYFFQWDSIEVLAVSTGVWMDAFCSRFWSYKCLWCRQRPVRLTPLVTMYQSQCELISLDVFFPQNTFPIDLLATQRFHWKDDFFSC